MWGLLSNRQPRLPSAVAVSAIPTTTYGGDPRLGTSAANIRCTDHIREGIQGMCSPSTRLTNKNGRFGFRRLANSSSSAFCPLIVIPSKPDGRVWVNDEVEDGLSAIIFLITSQHSAENWVVYRSKLFGSNPSSTTKVRTQSFS
jgi:hypothetical protein